MYQKLKEALITEQVTFLITKDSIPAGIMCRDAGRKAVDFSRYDRLTASLKNKKRRRHERKRKNKALRGTELYG